ncbi:Hypothetical protein NCS54_00135400 [Fusarium falciforme]|uniref:Hypothetical protein n=1 Tax=Fusarium falciforme TaxID=195108 RepID=UPI002300D7FB|nr:Hypothetical protein NCS54_00135400 [Fusarium falciforme]WAO84148.1 Hypothetical protein NCS54_00135400 [Fusarium falciforme]
MASQRNGEPQTAAKQPRVIRPMSHNEAYHSALHVLRQSAATVVACHYRLPEELTGRGTFEAVQDAFHRAMALTVLEHPMLQVGILNEDSAVPSWIELDSVDLSAHIEWEEVKPSQDRVARSREVTLYQLDTFFANVESKPGWRMSVLREEGNLSSLEVIFSWNHANVDGVSGKIFHQSLLRNLNDPRINEELPSLKGTVLHLESVADRFPPPPESLVNIPISLTFALSTIWKERRPPFLVWGDSTHATWAPIREEPYKTQFRTFSVDDATVKKVVSACREHKTTIAGLLHALPLASLALQLDEGKEHYKEDAKTMHAITALDTRRFMPTKPTEYPWHVPERTMDNELSLSFHTFDSKLLAEIRSKAKEASSENEIMNMLKDIVWSAAAKTRQEIQEKLDNGMNNDLLGLMKFVPDWRAQKMSQLKKPRGSAWGVSNLGTLDGEVEGPGWKIERAVFQLSCEITSPVFHISSISVKGRELCVDVSWQEGVINEAIGDKLAEDMEAWLRFLGA